MEKRNGEIVDYCNVFSNLKLALKDYTQEDDETEWPVKEKAELFRLLDDAIEQGFVFCHGKAVALREASGNDDVFKQVKLVVYPYENSFYLAYHVSSYKNIVERWEYFIDANTGKVINKYQSICKFHNHTSVKGEKCNHARI